MLKDKANYSYSAKTEIFDAKGWLTTPYIDTPLSQHFLEFSITDAVFAVPTHSPKDDNASEMTTFKCIHEVSFRRGLVNF